jgi:3-hydroxymyristoyl/3-hydroxydecanoyl-(acyl carrier protein) dehydratase
VSFLLVDRILEFSPGRSATGTLQIPPGPDDFPLALAVEALGQLATWIAMEHSDFQQRPVAAIAGEVLSQGDVRAGDLLHLSVDVSTLRSNAMRYRGEAHVDGRASIAMNRCTGAMLPMEVFDAADDVRAHFENLRRGNSRSRGFPRRSEFSPRIEWDEEAPEGALRATLEAPSEADFYLDHFPRKPVYPATLLLDAKIEIARRILTKEEPNGAQRWRVNAVRNVKVRAFTPPGGRVEVEVRETGTRSESGERTVSMEARSGAERVSSATVCFGPVPT